jgi:hypothetical protein
MLKRIIALLLSFVLLLGSAGCSNALSIPDKNANGLKWGNTLAAQQGEWVAMRGVKDGKLGLLLYNEKNQNTKLLVEGNVYYPAIMGNKIYFKYLDGSELYVYDPAVKDFEHLLSGVMAYQTRGSLIYYITDVHGNYLHTYNVESGEASTVNTTNTVDAFWLTDYGVYYHDDGKDLLSVIANDTGTESVVYQGNNSHCRDVVSLNGGADIAFSILESATTHLCTYNAANGTVTKHFSGNYTHYNLVGENRLVLTVNETIISVDYLNNKIYNWGDVSGYLYPQLLNEFAVVYKNDQPKIIYYPKQTA